ncbi:hypothetical protein GCM10019017_35380 [Streptomyces showdoensis]
MGAAGFCGGRNSGTLCAFNARRPLSVPSCPTSDTVYSGKNGRGAYVSAYHLSRWGDGEARDNGGDVIRDR